MSIVNRISKVFYSSEEITFNNSSKLVFISDCHRGDGGLSDNFSKNQNIYFSALEYYYEKGFTYIELGDGDELWENNKLCNIVKEHYDIYWILSKFFNTNRLHLIYGNHDKAKKVTKFLEKNLYTCFDEIKNTKVPLFPGIKIHEGLILRHQETDEKILLIHGHQGDIFNDKFGWLSKFLVRYFWKPLEIFGVNDPTSAAKNYVKKERVAKKLTNWVEKEKHMLICGHTHRPMFPPVGHAPYFNDGSCVHPHSITALEIVNGLIVLVKWQIKTKSDRTLFIGREILAGPERLEKYFKYFH